MLKHLLLLAAFAFVSATTFAQTNITWGGGRYDQKTFTVQKTANLFYGKNTNYLGLQDSLFVDVYQPANDPGTTRPLLVLAHGGGFLAGTKDNVDIVYLCNEFAKRGYVVACIKYRIGINVFGTLRNELYKAVWRGQQDGKCAVRYFNKSIANGNPYRISSNHIIVGGISAGGVLGLYSCFLDQSSETPALVDTVALGGIQGNSGNAGFSSSSLGVVNACGAVGSVTILQNQPSKFVVSAHGTADQTVPYKADFYRSNGLNIEILYGSFCIDSAAAIYGNPHYLHTFNGKDHVPWLNSVGAMTNMTYMDTTETTFQVFLYNQLSPIATQDLNALKTNVYPNPAINNTVNFAFELAQPQAYTLRITDLLGKTIYTQAQTTQSGAQNQSITLPENTQAGMYMYQLTTQNGQTATGKFMIK
jgi:hypothetical protein